LPRGQATPEGRERRLIEQPQVHQRQRADGARRDRHRHEALGGLAKRDDDENACAGGHYSCDQDTGQPADTSSNWLYAPYEQMQPKDWPLLTPTEQLGEAYRRCCTSLCWIGEGLAMRLLGAKDVWGHPAFFDYVDRWMTEDDTQAVAEILAQSSFDYSADWERQRQTAGWLQGEAPNPTFIDDMWKAYR